MGLEQELIETPQARATAAGERQAGVRCGAGSRDRIELCRGWRWKILGDGQWTMNIDLFDFAPEGRKGVGEVLNCEGKLFRIKECCAAENIQRNRQLLLQKGDGLRFVPAR